MHKGVTNQSALMGLCDLAAGEVDVYKHLADIAHSFAVLAVHSQ